MLAKWYPEDIWNAKREVIMSDNQNHALVFFKPKLSASRIRCSFEPAKLEGDCKSYKHDVVMNRKLFMICR